MPKVKYKNYCDKSSDEGVFFSLEEKGKAAYCGVSYPTVNSRSAVACERALSISGDSFLRRPSLRNEAMETISHFMSEGIYILQEPEKEFLCSTAIMYLFKGQARFFIAGSACACHFYQGKLLKTIQAADSPFVGQTLKRKDHIEEAISVEDGQHTFLLCSISDSFTLEDFLQKTGLSEGALLEECKDKLFSVPEIKACSVALIEIPERKGGIRPRKTE